MKTLIWLWGFAEYNSYCLRAAAGDVARTIVVSDFFIGSIERVVRCDRTQIELYFSFTNSMMCAMILFSDDKLRCHVMIESHHALRQLKNVVDGVKHKIVNYCFGQIT